MFAGSPANPFKNGHAMTMCVSFTALSAYLTLSYRSLSILVTVEMFNALNALSEKESLLKVKPWSNKWLILAIVVSFSQHFLVM